MTDEHTSDRELPSGASPENRGSGLVERAAELSQIGSFLILVCGILYFAQSLLLPVTLAFLFALVLSPVIRAFKRRGVPEGITAFLLVVMVATGVGFGTYSLSGPVTRWIEDAPQIGWELRRKLAVLSESAEKVQEAQKQIEEATEQDTEPGVDKVVVKEPGLLSRAAQGAPEVAAGAALTFVLLLFLLASGDMFYEKLVRALPTLKNKKMGLRIARDIEREISRYLFTISVINFCLGVVIAGGLYAIGMPNPILWGVVATLLNFVPYVGALVGIATVGIVALVSLPTLGHAVLAPIFYLLCTTIEGQFVTPAMVGRRLQINAVAVFLAIAFWGWLWGFFGIFMAVPLLIVVKTFSRHVEGLGGLEEFLAARQSGTTMQHLTDDSADGRGN